MQAEDGIRYLVRSRGLGDVYKRQAYLRITLPLLRPAVLVATVLNTIYVFNSFPIIYTLNDRNPGFTHDTTITFMYKLAFKSQEKDAVSYTHLTLPTSDLV